MMNFKNKKVLITGATGGIGNNFVQKFHNLGALVIGKWNKRSKAR